MRQFQFHYRLLTFLPFVKIQWWIKKKSYQTYTRHMSCHYHESPYERPDNRANTKKKKNIATQRLHGHFTHFIIKLKYYKTNGRFFFFFFGFVAAVICWFGWPIRSFNSFFSFALSIYLSIFGDTTFIMHNAHLSLHPTKNFL